MDNSFMTEEEQKEAKEAKKRSTWANVVAVIFLGVMVVWSLVSGLQSLLFAKPKEMSALADGIGSGTVYEMVADRTSDCYCVMKHTISGLIPIAKEYYYLIALTDQDVVISVRAGKNWSGANAAQVACKGETKRMDYEVRMQFQDVVNSISQEAQPTELRFVADYYIDLLWKQMAVCKLILGAGFLVIIAFIMKGWRDPDWFKINIQNRGEKNAVLTNVVVVLIVVFLMFAVWAISIAF